MNADALAGGAALAQHGRVHVLAGARVVPGALPLADVLELRRRAATCQSCTGVTRTGS